MAVFRLVAAHLLKRSLLGVQPSVQKPGLFFEVVSNTFSDVRAAGQVPYTVTSLPQARSIVFHSYVLSMTELAYRCVQCRVHFFCRFNKVCLVVFCERCIRSYSCDNRCMHVCHVFTGISLRIDGCPVSLSESFCDNNKLLALKLRVAFTGTCSCSSLCLLLQCILNDGNAYACL